MNEIRETHEGEPDNPEFEEFEESGDEEEEDSEVGQESEEGNHISEIESDGGNFETNSEDDSEVSMRSPRRIVRSQCPSPTDSLIEHTAALGLSDIDPIQEPSQDSVATEEAQLSKTVTKELSKRQARQKRFGGSRRIGRSKGSKAKQGFRYQSGDHEGWS
jgi:hypothetical protein